MAAGAGFKTFATGDILTAADANAYLMSQTVMVFASAAARTAAITSPQQGMISFLKDTNTTQYYNGTAWTALAPASTAKVLQVLSVTKTDTAATTSGTFADISGLSISITPSASTSKILVMWNTMLGVVGNATGENIRIVRGSTPICVGDAASNRPQITGGYYVGDAAAPNNYASVGGTYLDSPATTSATTYKLQFANAASASTVYVNRTVGDRDTAGYDPRGTSTLTVMEISA